MSRLIDAEVFGGKIESLIEWVDINLEEDRFSEGCKASLKDVLSTLKNFTPTVDAVPVAHGHWINDSCSRCGFEISQKTRSYCPNCGAKMDEEVEDEAN